MQQLLYLYRMMNKIPPDPPVLPGYTGFRSRMVRIGDIEFGGDRPIRVQSMTNSPTMDTGATVKQIAGLAQAGCELVRITAVNVREAEQLRIIRDELKKEGIRVPLAADIHYLKEAAEVAARYVDKVRINPGNYSETRKGLKNELSEKEYTEELEKIAANLYPLLKICKENGTAIRIGTNHGSLSERIVMRYGNTPLAMVESALEFARICRDVGFHELVLSMKASNIMTVLHANRLLVARMKEEGMDYPLHLGVTEAGEGEDGRIKSAAGIGILLSEGIGDTIRVSLTEDPLMEVPFAHRLCSMFNYDCRRKPLEDVPMARSPYSYQRAFSVPAGNIGGEHPTAVLAQEFPTQQFPTGEFPTPDFILKNNTLLNTITNTPFPVTLPGQATRPGQALILSSGTNEKLPGLRDRLISTYKDHGPSPVILHKDLCELKDDDLLIRASIDLGMALTDGYLDGVMLTGNYLTTEQSVRLAFDILQATGRRISKTEYISCPSCGRTKFDIQEVLKKVKAKTSHLVGLKIAVMGCIVNGPGEMADADFGYVGAGPGKVHIYKGHELIRRNVPQESAVEELLEVIAMYSPPLKGRGKGWGKSPPDVL